MANTVFCQKLKQELPALERPPIPGDLGKRIQANISAEAWKMFTEHFKRIINEYRLNMLDDSSNDVFYAEIERFLFEDVEMAPEGYVPPKA
jgi:Fe-S cluster biosynthesis and repair protein YggX